MKRALVFGVVLLICSPSLSHAGHIATIFPDNNGMAIVTSGELNGIDHFLLHANLLDFNLHGVFMTSSGNPSFATLPRPWLFGQLVSIVKNAPNVFTITWNIFTSTGGSAPFVPEGTIFLVVSRP